MTTVIYVPPWRWGERKFKPSIFNGITIDARPTISQWDFWERALCDHWEKKVYDEEILGIPYHGVPECNPDEDYE